MQRLYGIIAGLIEKRNRFTAGIVRIFFQANYHCMNKITFLCFFLTVFVSCGKKETGRDIYVLSINGKKIRVETAVTPEERSLGLMYRKSLASDSGMLFVYFRETKLSFWMKNTLIPLSIAFIDADMTIIDIQQMEPETKVSHTSPQPALYALEMNRAWFAEHGICPGHRVEGIEQAIAGQ